MKKSISTRLTIAIVAGVSFASQRLAAAVFEWSAMAGGNGHSYEVVHVPGGITWEAAMAAAGSRGGYLATLTNESENAFVFGLAASAEFWVQPYQPASPNSYGPWLGGYQPAGSPEPGGGWAWVHHDGAFTFANWEDGEPNEFEGDGENALMFFTLDPPSGPTWNDQPSGTRWVASYVIEFDAQPIPEPASGFAALGLSALVLAVANRRRPAARRTRPV